MSSGNRNSGRRCGRTLLAALLAVLFVFQFSCRSKYSTSDPILEKPVAELSDAEVARLVAVVSTNYGSFKIEMRPDYSPATSHNFVKLVKEGFYDGLTFHEIRPGIWIRGGDPAGDGSGGPGYTVPFEYPSGPHVKGAVGLYHGLTDFDDGGSQFYVMLGEMKSMDRAFTVFGKVIEGMAVVDRIGDIPVTPKYGKPRPYMPLSPVVIKDIKLVAKKG